MIKTTLSFLLVLASCGAKAQIYDTVDVLFPLNDAKLSKQATEYIDSLIFHDKLIHGQRFTVLGYSDYLGGKAHNETLSKTRAENVVKYLEFMGFEEKDITLVMGKGKIERAPVNGKEGMASDRKVQIVIDGNPRTSSPLGAAPAQPLVFNPGGKTPPPPPPVVPAPPSKTKGAKKVGPVEPPAPPKITTIDLTSIKVNEAVKLKNLLFYGDRHELLRQSEAELENLYKLMKDNYMVKIQIEGHICCMDPKEGRDRKDEDNSGMLSETRAKAIYDYLIPRGIEASRMKYVGYGNSKPLVPFPEMSESDRETNRRVEIRITSK